MNFIILKEKRLAKLEKAIFVEHIKIKLKKPIFIRQKGVVFYSEMRNL